MTFRRFGEGELPALLALWQKTLRLQDWDVDVSIVPQDEMEDASHRGEIEYEVALNDAIVRLLRPEDYDNEWYDMEKTLVHELLHLKFSMFDEAISKHKYLDTPLEVAVDTTARTLVDLARQTPGFYSPLGSARCAPVVVTA
jgi:hypothetical protein